MYVIKNMFTQELLQIYLEGKECFCIELLGIKYMDQQTNTLWVTCLQTKLISLHMSYSSKCSIVTTGVITWPPSPLLPKLLSQVKSQLIGTLTSASIICLFCVSMDCWFHLLFIFSDSSAVEMIISPQPSISLFCLVLSDHLFSSMFSSLTWYLEGTGKWDTGSGNSW